MTRSPLICLLLHLKITVKQTPYRPITGPEGCRRLYMKVVRLSVLRTGLLYPPPLPKKYCWYSFVLESESTPGPPRIEPATFRLVAQCLNQLRHRVPPSTSTMITLTAPQCFLRLRKRTLLIWFQGCLENMTATSAT
jgi:hypothetical protein